MGIGAKGNAVVCFCVGFQGIGKTAASIHAMQPLKGAMVPGIAGDLDCPYLHPGLGTLPGTGGMVLETQLTGRKEQQPPGLALSQLAVLLTAALALAVGQHVGSLPCFPAVQLTQFIQTEQGIIAPAGDPLNGVAGSPPGLGIPIRVPINTRGRLHHGGLAVGTLTLQVEATALHAHQGKQGSREGE